MTKPLRAMSYDYGVMDEFILQDADARLCVITLKDEPQVL